MATTAHRMHLSGWDRLVLVLSWGGAGALFLTLGALVMAPDDPQGAVSLLSRHHWMSMYVQACALAIVVSGITTFVAGRSIADVGTLATTLGLTAVSLTGGTVEALLVDRMDLGGNPQRSLALNMTLEALAWFGVVVAVVFVSAAVLRWVYSDRSKSEEDVSDLRSLASRATAGFDCLGLSRRLFGVSRQEQTPPGYAVQHTLICAGSIFGLHILLSMGLGGRGVAHGQVCFAVAAAAFLGASVAHHFAPVRSAWWSILGVSIAAVGGYLWAWLRVGTQAKGFPNLPASSFLRILPLQYIAVGTATAILAFWYCYDPIGRTSQTRRSGSTP